ncbi:30S ribosomal protein S2 [Candidatus Falkowbacteria bacterium]|jgi:small subunit ribosomal protein S2|nr:30S ribosomal protein S2 [Candidatus Falkowbacteria bacterium]MBT7007470.1 30S ribosomal protein S2 [Candidatus Falkowbacteria bacterium]
MTKVPELKELMKAGVHFGHQKSKWHPKMAPFIFADKGGVHVINLEETQKQLESAIKFVQETVKNGGNVLFLSTKKQAKSIVRDAAISCEMPYIISRWLGGTFTNATSVLNLVKKYRNLIKEKETGEIERYTKKEQLQLTREMKRLEVLIGGISNITKIPDAIFIVDIKLEKTAVLEANKVSVPVIALCDTNVNVNRVDYPIPANDDAISSIKLIVNTIAKAIKDVKESSK